MAKEASTVAQKKPLKGVGETGDETQKDRRYGKRAKEVAARTVMKHHREEHHDKGE